MPRILRKRQAASDDALGWIGIGLVLVAAIVLDKGSAPHKWHAAIMWTFVAFFGILIFGRKNRGSWLFWLFWAACLGLHMFAMWVIFGQLLPRLILGTLYVIPIAFIEAIFLVVMFAKLERNLTPEHHRRV
jgi:hypothetical protein